MGALNLKLADPDHFDLTNVQRQYGAGRDTIGRNKAEVVAEQVFALTGDAHIDVFPEGITPDTAEEFMDGCDYVMDRSYRTWDQDLSKRTYFGHPPAEASLESRV